MSTRRLLSWDGDPNSVATWWIDDDDGNWAVEVVQDTNALLNFNVERQNHYDMRWSDGDTRMVASIPHVVIELWKKLYGVDYYSRDPDMQRKVDKLLNDSDWYKLRTDGSTL
jgi:hypothetical protein